MANVNMCSGEDNSDDIFQKRIFIIGAGIAGLACASHLNELGFDNITILEAKNRVGGRIHTIPFGNNFIELGAQWIHGQQQNIIYELASSKDLVDEEAPDYFKALLNIKCFRNEEKEVVFKLIEFLDGKMDCTSEDLGPDSTVLSYLHEQYHNFVTQHSAHSFEKCLSKVYEWYCKLLCELNGCLSLSSLSLPLLSSYKECEGLQNVELKYGYYSVLNLFLQKIPAKWILKCKVVTRIDWSDFKNTKDIDCCTESEMLLLAHTDHKKSITILCDDGTVYMADHVIVTIPLGSLKKCLASLFVPPLCEMKQKAIQCLGFDVVNKVYLEFEDPFWQKSAIFPVLWEKAFDEKFVKEDCCEDEVSVHWVRDINRFAYTLSHPSMLCAWVVGEGAVVMESLSDGEVMTDCMSLLELILKKELPRPCRIIRSTWSSDPHTCGSYSYLSVECKKETVSHLDLAEPEYSNVLCSKHPVLMFAGEATHGYHFSTVHGACESGLREADRLFRHYRY